jgi:hypothetical protein
VFPGGSKSPQARRGFPSVRSGVHWFPIRAVHGGPVPADRRVSPMKVRPTVGPAGLLVAPHMREVGGSSPSSPIDSGDSTVVGYFQAFNVQQNPAGAGGREAAVAGVLPGMRGAVWGLYAEMADRAKPRQAVAAPRLVHALARWQLCSITTTTAARRPNYGAGGSAMDSNSYVRCSAQSPSSPAAATPATLHCHPKRFASMTYALHARRR